MHQSGDHTVFHNLLPLPEYSADIIVSPRRQAPAQRGFFRSHLLVILATRQPLHVSIGVCSPRVCQHLHPAHVCVCWLFIFKESRPVVHARGAL